jgi:hypothetical protein
MKYSYVVEVEVNLQPTVISRLVCLGVRRPSGTFNQFFFLFEIPFRHLHVCYFVASSLTRGRVCNLLYNCFWALPEQSLLGRSPAELTTIFYCFIWDSPNLEGQVPVFISPRNRVAQLYPWALGSLYVASYDSQGSGGGLEYLHCCPASRKRRHKGNPVPSLHELQCVFKDNKVCCHFDMACYLSHKYVGKIAHLIKLLNKK